MQRAREESGLSLAEITEITEDWGLGSGVEMNIAAKQREIQGVRR